MDSTLTSSSSIAPVVGVHVNAFHFRQQVAEVSQWLGAATADSTKGNVKTILHMYGNVLHDEINAEYEAALDLAALRSARLLEQMNLASLLKLKIEDEEISSVVHTPRECESDYNPRESEKKEDLEREHLLGEQETQETACVKKLADEIVVHDASIRQTTPTTMSATTSCNGETSAATHRSETETPTMQLADVPSQAPKDMTYLGVLVNSVATHGARVHHVAPQPAATSAAHVRSHRSSERIETDQEVSSKIKPNVFPMKHQSKAKAKHLAVQGNAARGNDSKFALLHVEYPGTSGDESSEVSWQSSTKPLKPQATRSQQSTKKHSVERKKDASERRRRMQEASDEMLLDDAIRKNAEYQLSASSDATTSLLSVAQHSQDLAAASPSPQTVPEVCTRFVIGAFVAFSSARRSILAQFTRQFPSIASLMDADKWQR